MYEMYKHFFFKLYASNLIEGAFSNKIEKKIQKMCKKYVKMCKKYVKIYFVQLYTLNYEDECMDANFIIGTQNYGAFEPNISMEPQNISVQCDNEIPHKKRRLT